MWRRCSNRVCRQNCRQKQFFNAQTDPKPAKRLLKRVELRGFEPLTPTLPVWCATNCAIAPYIVPTEVTPLQSAPQNRWLGQLSPELRTQSADRGVLRGGAQAGFRC